MSAEPQCPGCRERDEIIRELRVSLEARIAELEQRVRELEAVLNLNSSNSSGPPSSDPPQAPNRPSKPPTGRRPGGQPGHPGHSRTRLSASRVNEVVPYRPAACERCQTALQTALMPVREELRAALEVGASCDDVRVRRFCRNVLAVYSALWTLRGSGQAFARVEGVEPTDNHAERTLRRAVIWRKVSFGNHSDAGCRFAERLLTVVQTLRLQHRPVLDYLRQAVVAHRAASPAPVLCAVGV